MWNVLKDFERRLFIFKEVNAFVYKCEFFVEIKRLLNGIFREVEAFFN
jgi:hypothetical protein